MRDIEGSAGILTELTPEWLEAQLKRHVPGVRLEGVDIQPVGAGQISATYRVTPIYAEDSAPGPSAVILKRPPDEPSERAVAESSGSYRVEIRFYRELAAGLGVQVPKFYGGDWNENGDYLLVIEDGSPATPGDQIEGSSVEQAQQAIDELVPLHVAYWNSASTARLPWIRRRTEEWNRQSHIAEFLTDRFRAQYEDRIPESVAALGDDHGPILNAYLAKTWDTLALTHGDYRVDNLLFDPEPSVRATVVDWGGAAEGPPLADVAYYIGGSLSAEDRRSAERDLVRRYVDQLAGHGILLDWGSAWAEYAMHAISGLVMSTFAAVSVKRTERGDTMFLTMADRYATQIIDLGAHHLVRAG